jgi:hypothetical protein
MLLDRLVERAFSSVAKGGMANVVPERDRLDQVFVEPQSPADRARDLGHFEGVGQAGPVMIALRVDEHLGLVLEPPERLGVEDPVAVALKDGPHRILRFVVGPARALRGLGGKGGEMLELALLGGEAYGVRHVTRDGRERREAATRMSAALPNLALGWIEC